MITLDHLGRMRGEPQRYRQAVDSLLAADVTSLGWLHQLELLAGFEGDTSQLVREVVTTKTCRQLEGQLHWREWSPSPPESGP